MSQSTATARSGLRAYRLAPPTRRPSLRIISAEPGAPAQLPFVLLCSGFLALGLIVLLLLNTSMAKGAYLMHELEVTSTRLAEDEMALREELGTVSSAASLAAAANKLGMIPLGQPPLTLELSTGTVRGLTREQAPAGEEPFSVTLVPQYEARVEGKEPVATAKPERKREPSARTDAPAGARPDARTQPSQGSRG